MNNLQHACRAKMLLILVKWHVRCHLAEKLAITAIMYDVHLNEAVKLVEGEN